MGVSGDCAIRIERHHAQPGTPEKRYLTPFPPSNGLTIYTYDSLGRVSNEGSTPTCSTQPKVNTMSISYPDGSCTSTKISGLSSTVIDPAGNTRALGYDELGRLTSVSEAGLYSTGYTYDLLNNLLTVTQGSQTRTFAYDSLSRLTSASNPESGATTYTYPPTYGGCSGDPSLPCTRTDARNITTTYSYDALHRLTSKVYSDGTPTANFAYDETTVTLGSWTSPTLNYPKGRLTHTTTTSGSTTLTATVQDYDKMGRTKDYWQCTPLNCGTSSIWAALYTYDNGGDLTSWSHPAGFTITQTINEARQVTQVTSSLSDSTHPGTLAEGLFYTPWAPSKFFRTAAWGARRCPKRSTSTTIAYSP